MLKGELRIPADAPVLRPGRFARFAAFWCKAYVPVAYGPDATVQPSADQVREWIAADDEAGKAERLKPPPKLDGVFDQQATPPPTLADLHAAQARRDEHAINQARRESRPTARSFAGVSRPGGDF